MTDAREWRFGDWLRLFLRVIPAFLSALAVVLAPIVLALIFTWWLLPLRTR